MTPNEFRRKLNNARRTARREAVKYLRKRIPEYIILRTKAGEGVDNELPRLKESTINNRERYARQLSRDTSPNESNLTASGQLLKAIISEITANSLKFSINDKTRKKWPKPISKDRQLRLSFSKTSTNNEIREHLEKKGFKFFGLSDFDMEELGKETKNLVLEILKRELNA